MVTQSRLKQLSSYDPETGVFVWTLARRGVRVGQECGRISKTSGYRDIGVDGGLHKASRLAFVYMTGAYPRGVVDHINGNRSDDRWANLRDVSHSENCANVALRSDNTSGAHGVVWDAARSKWRAQIRVDGKKVNLGRFADKSEAIKAHKAASNEQWSHVRAIK